MTGPLSSFLRHFRRQHAVHDAEEVTDRDLLQRFACGRDGDAFAELVHRYGPLVMGVCHRVLRQEQDAEDVFQATFLVLARKAGSISQPERLGNWLYGVASRVARKARADANRRLAHQDQVTDLPASQPDPEADWKDLRQLLDDEVRRLPDKFRAPLVLCYLQGLTREEAGERLGRSAGAVKGMLERGRELLRSRLARRGVTLSAGSLTVLLSENALSAAVPAGLSDSTVKAALAFAVGKVACNAAVLAEGVLQTMLMTRVKVWLAVALLLALVGAGAGVLGFGGRSQQEPATPKKAEPAPKAEEKADQLKRLAEERLDAARTAYEGYWTRFVVGRDREEAVHLWSRRWLQAQLDLSDKKADRDAALAAYQDRLKKTDELARARLLLGNARAFDREETLDSRTGHKKFDTEQEYFETAWKAYEKGETGEEQVCLESVRCLIERHQTGRIFKEIDPKAALQAHLDRVKKVERIARLRFEAGRTTIMESRTATFFRLQAEEWLAQGKTFERNDQDLGAESK